MILSSYHEELKRSWRGDEDSEPIGAFRLQQTGCVLSGSVCCVLSLCCYWPSTSLLSLFIPLAYTRSVSLLPSKHYKWCFNKWPRQQWGRFKLNSVLSQAKEASRLRPGHLKMSPWLDRTLSNRQRVSARHNSIAFRHKVIGPFLLWMCCGSGWERVPGD